MSGAGPRGRALSLEYPMSLAVYDTYPEAQKAVDFLSDHQFPVQDVLIVGTDLRQLERVTGRLTTGRVLAGGVLSGAWLGLLIGLIFSMFSTGFGLANVFGTIVFGAVFGMVWALVGYLVTRGQRDFTSVSMVVATKYEILVEHKHAARGRELLTELDPMRAAQQAADAEIAKARAAEAQVAQAQPPQIS